jgi:hypothetical protein
MYKVFDLFAFNDNSRNWSTDLKTLYDGRKAEGIKRLDGLKAMRVPDTKPSLPLTAYVGRYSDPFYGSVDVSLANGKLRAVFSKDLSADLAHWQFDTFMGTWNRSWWDEGIFAFGVSPVSGDVESISADGAVLKKELKAVR